MIITPIIIILWFPLIIIFLIQIAFDNLIKSSFLLKIFCLFLNIFILIMSFFILKNIYIYNQESEIPYIFLWYHNFWYKYTLQYSILIDGLSISFIILTIFLHTICILVSWNNIQFKNKEFYSWLFFSQFCISNFFCVIDFTLFFIFFEAILIPIYLLIGIWGSNLRKIYASFQLFFFTLFGSIFMFFCIMYLYIFFGTTDYIYIYMYINNINLNIKLLIFIFFFLTFAIKVPIVPFHFWLPEAHVEAPTVGSVILAGLLLKLGTYGLIRFLIPLFADIIIYLSPIINTICLYSAYYGCFLILRQIDLKRIIAYSSIIHMNFILLGLVILTKNTLLGSIFLLISHGIVSSALFICIGFLYERYHTRIILYYKGLVIIMPLFIFFLFFFFLANASLPITSNFTGEFLVLLGIFEFNKIFSLLLIFILFYSSIINFWIYNKIAYGNINKSFITYNNDLSFREFIILGLLFIGSILMGIYPNNILKYIKPSVYLLLNN